MHPEGFEKGAERAERSTEHLEGKIGGIGKVLGIAFGAAAIGVGAELFHIGSDVEEMSNQIRVATGKTGKDLEELVDSGKKIFSQVPDDMDKIGQVVSYLNSRLGLTGDHLDKLGVTELNLARITGSDLNTTLDATTRMFGDWGISIEDQVPKLDELLRASQATHVPVDQLSEDLAKYGSPMRELGFSFEQVTALLGDFRSSGVNTELVMGSLRISLGKFAKAGVDPVVALTSTIQKIKEAGSVGEANAIALDVFGAKAGPDMAAAIREGHFDIDSLVNQIANGKDTIDAASNATLTWEQKLRIAGHTIEIAFMPAAEKLMDGLMFVSDAFLKMVRTISYLHSKGLNPLQASLIGFRQFLDKFTGGKFDGIFKSLEGPILAIGHAIGVVIGWGEKAFETFDKLNRHGVSPLHAALIALRQFIDKFTGGAFDSTLKHIEWIILDVVKTVGDIIHGRWGKIWGDFKAIAVQGIALLISLKDDLWRLIKNIFNSIDWSKLGGFFVDAFKKIDWTRVGEVILHGLNTALSKILGQDKADSITGFITKLVEEFEKLTPSFDSIKGFAEGAATVLLKVFKEMSKHADILVPALVGAVVGMKAFAVAESIAAVVTGILDAELAPISVTMLVIMGIGALFAVAWVKNFGNIRGITAQVFAALKVGFQVLARVVPPLVKEVAKLAEEIVHFASKIGVFKRMEILAKDVYKIFKDVVKLFGDLIHGRWGAVWHDLVQIVKDYLGLLFDYWMTAPTILWNAITSIDWGGIASSILNGITAAFSGAGTLLLAAGNLIIAGLSEGITKGWNWMISWLVDMPGWIIGIFDNAVGFLYSAGVDLLQGLENGISDGWDAFKSWLTGLWDALPGWAKKAWSIASPSGVFKDIGHNLMKGLGLGIDQMAPVAHKAMDNAIEKMNAKMSPKALRLHPMASVAGSGALVMKGGDTYHINVHETSSAEATAKEIILEIKRRQAGK